VKWTADKTVISVEGIPLPVEAFEISHSGSKMSCTFGTADDPSEINQKDPKSPTGKWRGHQWRIQKGSPDILSTANVVDLKFSVGVDEAGRNLLYLRVLGRREGQPMDVGAFVRWP
jgi:hypothetical protein